MQTNPVYYTAPEEGCTKVSFPELLTISSLKPDIYSRFLVMKSLNAARPVASESVFFICNFWSDRVFVVYGVELWESCTVSHIMFGLHYWACV